MMNLNSLIPNSQVNFSTASTETIVNESFSSVQSRFGGTGSFNSLNVGAPSFDQLGADYALGTIDNTDDYFYTAASVYLGVNTASATANEMNAAIGGQANSGDNDHVVRLTSKIDTSEVVTFDIMPEISENRQADYESLSAAQMPGEFQKYKGTKSTTWQINGMFTCRTVEEATRNLNYINLLRAWLEPFFGSNQRERLGAPPPVLDLTGWRELVGPVPVVMTQLNWTWPKDCDWIPTSKLDENNRNVPFPTVMNVQMTVVESFSAEEFNGFNLAAFKSGKMVNAYKPMTATQATVNEAQTAGGNQSVQNGTPSSTNSMTTSEAFNYIPSNTSNVA